MNLINRRILEQTNANLELSFKRNQELDASLLTLLNANELHIWKLNLMIYPANAEQFLDEVELERYQRILPLQKKVQFLAAHYWLRRILGTYLNQNLKILRFTISEYGKPYLVGQQQLLQFNLSHTGNHAVLIVSAGTTVGIDLEQIRPKVNILKIAHQLFQPTEIQFLSSLFKTEQTDYFFKYWTIMEARQKCLGLGIFNKKVINQDIISRAWKLNDYLWLAVAWDKSVVQHPIRLRCFLAPANNNH